MNLCREDILMVGGVLKYVKSRAVVLIVLILALLTLLACAGETPLEPDPCPNYKIFQDGRLVACG